MEMAEKAKKIYRNPKTVLRIMKKYELLSEICRRRKWKQMGQQLHKYENLLNREFQADRPNHKWVTDISYIHTGQGVLYLSVIRDLFDNSIVAHKTGISQSVNVYLYLTPSLSRWFSVYNDIGNFLLHFISESSLCNIWSHGKTIHNQAQDRTAIPSRPVLLYRRNSGEEQNYFQDTKGICRHSMCLVRSSFSRVSYQ